MKIVKVIHGYPDRYNAGSEVYTQLLCQELSKQGHDVIVFTRQENAYQQEYSTTWESDPWDPSIKLCLINMAHAKDGYRHTKVDEAFADLLDQHQPDLVHIGHLNHLSTSLIFIAHQKQIPIVFTLHDFWLMCPRGQFLQGINSKSEDLYPVCKSQQNEKCAKHCYWRYFSHPEDETDLKYWTSWVGKRMDHVREMASYIDLLIAPSQYLMNRFIQDFNTEPSKIVYLDYGFQLDRLQGRERIPEKEFVFGYIGTHKQAKGIFHLLQAFHHTNQKAQLKIWGSALPPFTQSLHSYVKTLGPEIERRVHWMGGYRNHQIVQDVFNHVDAIVVPSIWGENSPLVIHEALEAGVPVITADYGGMKEYIHHEINGLLFEHRNPFSLAEQMQKFLKEPGFALELAKRGYLRSEDGHIPSIQAHTKQVIGFYQLAIERRRKFYDPKTRPLAYHL